MYKSPIKMFSTQGKVNKNTIKRKLPMQDKSLKEHDPVLYKLIE